MSDIKLFRVDNGKANELAGSALSIATLQSLIEPNLESVEAVSKPPLLVLSPSIQRRHSTKFT
jgi:hypothetical protein